MKKILAFNGSIRKTGNTANLLSHFIEGCRESTDEIEIIDAHNINLHFCSGCLRCNILKKCSLRDDDWEDISKKIIDADILVFASPIYFHHLSAQLKKIIDRFRSFVHVQITETGLIHTPHQEWEKDFVLLMSMGSPDDQEAQPLVEMFEYMTNILGEKNKLHIIKGTRLAVVNQVVKTQEELEVLYSKLLIPPELVAVDYKRNQEILEECRELGGRIANC